MAAARVTSDSDTFIKSYMERILQKANSFRNDRFEEVYFLYRNKPAKYFDEVEENDMVMPRKTKDKGGDPRSPINDSLAGVFFCVTLYKGQLPTISPYGDVRIHIPIEAVFGGSSNLYFADFYCFEKKRKNRKGKKENHYIILVLTEEDTAADTFCQENLPKLDPYCNSFFWRSPDGSPGFYTASQEHLYIEVFYTDEVDINNLQSIYGEDRVYFETGFGDGHSTVGGIPKSKYCQICNLRPRELQEIEEELQEEEDIAELDRQREEEEEEEEENLQ